MTYQTVSGDLFDLIAFKIFGDVRFTGQLMQVNRDALDTLIFPAGKILNVPTTKEKKFAKLPPWKS